MSFYISLTGLKAAQTDLATISNNVANVSTYGFKKSRAEFGDLVALARNTPGNGTRLKSIEQQFSQGGTESTARELDVAVAGSGFFITRSTLTGGSTQFTRNGSFQIDGERYLRDSGGGYVQVLPVDPNGNATASGITATQNLQLPLTNGTPQATSEVKLGVNLPRSADKPADRAVYTTANPWAFDRLDPNSYNHAAQTTVYDSSGAAIPATMYYVRTTSTQAGDTTDTWTVHTFVGGDEITSNPAATTQPAPLTLSFDGTGALIAPTGPVTYGPATPAGVSAPLNLTFDYTGGTAQTAGGTFALASLEQDGVTAGKLDDLTIGEDGLVTATFSDGSTVNIGKLAVANFANPSGLKQRGDAHWSTTADSGNPVVGVPGGEGFGRLQSGALERSNVDITEELVALISAQRDFQANAKAIDTSNQITQAIINLRS